jgi:hypothetical protein
MRFSHLLAASLLFIFAAVSQPVAQVTSRTGNPSRQESVSGWSSLPTDARRAIRAALEAEDPGWIQQAELTASDGANGDYFGMAAAVSSNTIVIGAPSHTVGSNQSQGAAYVFVKGGEAWSQQAELAAPDGEAGDGFGNSVAISGSTIVVGTRCHPASGPNCGQGAAYVFVESGGTWSQQAELAAPDGEAGDRFGNSVAISGSTIVVGAPYHEVYPHFEQGAAYVFVQGPAGTWIQQAELTAPDGTLYSFFGDSVAIDGNTIVAGAPQQPFNDFGGGAGPGALYVFEQNDGTWTQQAELTASDGVGGDDFGNSAAVSGSTAVVGAYCHPFAKYNRSRSRICVCTRQRNVESAGRADRFRRRDK